MKEALELSTAIIALLLALDKTIQLFKISQQLKRFTKWFNRKETRYTLQYNSRMIAAISALSFIMYLILKTP